MIALSALVRLTYVASGSVVKCSLNMNNEEKKKRKHGRFVEEADRGRHETDHRRHEADRGRHEAEQEKTKGICGSPWVPIL
ncbi:hypothetical protein T01_6199 [Trichinella spiralis]|uniref:Secreted protein n=1 Tax=Trichinella spiralis TaxID=6334 RepID=A0A0V1BEL9_TRISP|nr:hypothetical protein T01_6199 [Trichinella spiralis]